MIRSGISTLFCFGWLMAFAKPAEAYLDPATSSFLLQILFAAAAAALFFFKTVWQKIRDFLAFVGLMKNETMPTESDEDPEN